MIDSDRFSQPVFIVSSPRSGSSFLFETLARSKNVWTIGDESHEAIEGIAKLHLAQRNYDSNRLTERDADRWCCVTYQDLIANLPGEVKRLCEFAGWEWDLNFSEPFPLSRHTLTPPAPDKWKKNGAEIEAVLPQVAEIASKAKDAIALRLLSRN